MRRLVSALLALALALSLTGCSGEKNNRITVYLLAPLDADEPVGAAEIEVAQGANRYLAAMRALINPPASAEGLSSPYREGVRAEKAEREGELLTVWLSEEYLLMDGVELAEAEGCAALTLLGFEEIGGVRFVVDGKPHPRGEQGYLTEEDVVRGEIGSAALEREITLYFRSDASGHLSAERRGIVLREGEAVERYVVEELIKGPTQDGLAGLLPESCKLLSVSTEGGVCSLDFSREFLPITEGSRSDERIALMSLANSIIASSSAEMVRFFCEGEPLYGGAALRECESETDSYNYAAFEVWLPSADGEHVEPASVMLPIDGEATSDRLLVEYLIGGADGAGFGAVLPGGTKILRMNCSSSYCYLDFSAEFVENIGEGYNAEQALKALVHTLYHNGYAHYGLEISVEGTNFRLVSAESEDIHPDFR